jgi:hypothetical protein
MGEKVDDVSVAITNPPLIPDPLTSQTTANPLGKDS